MKLLLLTCLSIFLSQFFSHNLFFLQVFFIFFILQSLFHNLFYNLLFTIFLLQLFLFQPLFSFSANIGRIVVCSRACFAVIGAPPQPPWKINFANCIEYKFFFCLGCCILTWLRYSKGFFFSLLTFKLWNYFS